LIGQPHFNVRTALRPGFEQDIYVGKEVDEEPIWPASVKLPSLFVSKSSVTVLPCGKALTVNKLVILSYNPLACISLRSKGKLSWQTEPGRLSTFVVARPAATALNRT
jgi:hypothetical protein